MAALQRLADFIEVGEKLLVVALKDGFVTAETSAFKARLSSDVAAVKVCGFLMIPLKSLPILRTSGSNLEQAAANAGSADNDPAGAGADAVEAGPEATAAAPLPVDFVPLQAVTASTGVSTKSPILGFMVTILVQLPKHGRILATASHVEGVQQSARRARVARSRLQIPRPVDMRHTNTHVDVVDVVRLAAWKNPKWRQPAAALRVSCFGWSAG